MERKRKILIVDEGEELEGLRVYLEYHLDCEIISLRSLGDALMQACNNADIAVIILGLNAQERELGYQMVDTIKNRQPEMFIIVVAGYSLPPSMPEEGEEAYVISHGQIIWDSADGKYAKPLNMFKMELIKDNIERFLSRNKPAFIRHYLPPRARERFQEQWDGTLINTTLITDPLIGKLIQSRVILFGGTAGAGKTTAVKRIRNILKNRRSQYYQSRQAKDKSLIRQQRHTLVRENTSDYYYRRWLKNGRRDSMAVTLTSRPKEGGEREGLEHWWMSKEEIRELWDSGLLALYTELLDTRTGEIANYGIERDELVCRMLMAEYETALLGSIPEWEGVVVPTVIHGKTPPLVKLKLQLLEGARLYILHPANSSIEDQIQILQQRMRARGIDAVPSVQQIAGLEDLILGPHLLFTVPAIANGIVSEIDEAFVFHSEKPPGP